MPDAGFASNFVINLAWKIGCKIEEVIELKYKEFIENFILHNEQYMLINS